MANAEKVLMALGLQDIADNYEPLVPLVKISLQKAIADVRAQNLRQLPDLIAIITTLLFFICVI